MTKPKRREEPTKTNGKKGYFPTGGRAGRRPGLGGSHGDQTTSGGAGRKGPAQGFARSKVMSKPPDKNPLNGIILNIGKPPPKPKS